MGCEKVNRGMCALGCAVCAAVFSLVFISESEHSEYSSFSYGESVASQDVVCVDYVPALSVEDERISGKPNFSGWSLLPNYSCVDVPSGIYETSQHRVATTYAGGAGSDVPVVEHTSPAYTGELPLHTFLALSSPVRTSAAAFEEGSMPIGATSVQSPNKRFAPGGNPIGDGNGDNNQSAVDGALPDAVGFLLLLVLLYVLKPLGRSLSIK